MYYNDYDSFLRSSITALFPSLLSSPLPPSLYIPFILFFSPHCVFYALYISQLHTPLTLCSSFTSLSHRLHFFFKLSPTRLLLFPYSLFLFLLPHISFINISPLTPLSHTPHFYMYILFFPNIFELLIIFSYLDGMETISLPYFVERVVSVLLSVHCITTSAPFV